MAAFFRFCFKAYKTIYNIKHDENRCIGYAVLYFVKHEKLLNRDFHCSRAYLNTEKSFPRHYLNIIAYLIF